MSFYLSDKDYKDMMGMLYGDKKGSESSGYLGMPTEYSKPQQQGIVADTVDAVQMGAWKGASDVAHGLGALTGAEWLHKVGDWAAEGADENLATMSDEMKAALNQNAFDGEGQGVRNIRWWAGNLGSLIGQNLDTAVTLAAGKLATIGVKQAGKLLLKKEAAEQVGKTAVEQAAKRGIPQKYWNMVGITATMSAMSGGNRYSQKRDEIMGMSNEQLAQIPQFSDAYYEIADSEEGKDKTTEQLYDMAKSRFADKVGRDAALNPAAIATDLATNAVSGLGGGFLGLGSAAKTIKGGLLKGAVVEGGTEAIQGIGEQYALNKAEQDNYNSNKDLTEGMTDNAINGAILGGVFGSAMGGLDTHTDRRAFNNQKRVLLNHINTGNEAVDNQLRNYVDMLNQGATDLSELVSASRVQALNNAGIENARARQAAEDALAQQQAKAKFESDFFGEEQQQEQPIDSAFKVDPKLERALDLHSVLGQFRNNDLSRANEFIDTPMVFDDAQAKKDYVTSRALDEVRNIAQSYGIDPQDGKAMRQWLEDYAEKAKEYRESAEFVSPDNTTFNQTQESSSPASETESATITDGVDFTLPQGEDIRYSFAGENAQTADKDLLVQAKSAVENGRNPEVVRRETGWFQGIDGKWRFELDSSKFELSPDLESGLSQPISKLSDVIDAESLFKAYPDLADLRVVRLPDSERSYYSPRDDAIYLRENAQNLKSVLMHEIQHAIQERENFARGGSDENSRNIVRNLRDNFLKETQFSESLHRQAQDLLDNAANSSRKLQEFVAYDAARQLRYYANSDSITRSARHIFNNAHIIDYLRSDIFNGKLNVSDEVKTELADVSQMNYHLPKRTQKGYGTALSQYAQRAANAIEQTISESSLAEFNADPRSSRAITTALKRAYNKAYEELAPLNEAKSKAQRAEELYKQHSFSTPYDIYLALGGEVEARNVQTRLNMSEEDRRNISPMQTEDVARYKQIPVLPQENGNWEVESFSLDESANSDFARAVDKIAQGKRGRNDRFLNMGTTPSVLKMLGITEVKVAMRENVIDKILFDHNVSASDLKQIPAQINNPIAVMRSNPSSTNPNGLVVLTELNEVVNGKEKQVIAALQLKKSGEKLEVINIASVYGRDLDTQIRNDLSRAIYWNKTKGYQFARTVGLQLPSSLTSVDNLSAFNIKTESDLSQYLSAKNNQESPSNPEIQRAQAIVNKTFGKAAQHIEVTTSANPPKDVKNLITSDVEGWFNPKTGKITIVADSIKPTKTMTKDERLQFVAWHEIAHRGINVGYKGTYDNLMADVGKNKAVSQIADAIQNQRKGTDDLAATNRTVAIEEAIAEIMAANETGKWNELESRYGVEIKKGQRQSVKSWLSMTAQRIKEFLSKIFGTERASQFSDEDVLNLITNIKKSAVGNVNESLDSEGVRYSLSESAHSDFAKAVDEIFNSSETRFDNNRWIELGTTPEALVQSGITEEPMYINFAKIGKIKNDHPEMTSDVLKQIPKELNNPVAVFKNTKGKSNSYVVLTELSVKGNERVIAALHADQEMNGLIFHKLASAYGKDGTRAYLENMIEKSDVRFVDKQKAGRINSKLQLLADDTLDLLFNKASVVKDESSVNGENSDIRFSRRAKQEYKRDLMVTHNISAEGILHANKMGGLPLASVAVAKQSNPLTGFGEVTLIGSRDYIDPKGVNKAKVFGSDIYSPRYPRITYEYSAKDQKALFDRFKESAKEIEDHSFDYNFTQGLNDTGARQAMLDSDAVKYQFLKQHNIPYEQGYREIQSSQYATYPSIQKAIKSGITPNDLKMNGVGKYDGLFREFIQDYIQEHDKNDNPLIKNVVIRAKQALKAGEDAIRLFAENRVMNGLENQRSGRVPDRTITLSNMRKAVERNSQAFREYVDSIANGMEAKEKIWNGTDNQGRNRYVAHTLENVVKKLKKDLRGGESFNYGMPNVRAAVTPKFKTIADIQENKHRLVSKEEFEKARDRLDAESSILADKLGVNSWDIYDVLWNTVDENIFKAFGYAGIEDTPSNRKAVSDFLRKLEDLPTEYFEGKAKDITQFSDFAGAVVPNDIAKNAYDVLANSGLKIFTYDSSDPQSRANTIKQATNQLDEERGGDILFSRANTIQSALELSQSTSAEREPTVWDDLKAKDFSSFKERFNRVVGKVDEMFADSLRPVNDWIDSMSLADQTGNTSSRDHEKRRLKDAMYTAKGKRDAFNSELEQAYLKPILSKIAALSKATKKGKNPIDELTMKRKVGNWISARYSIEKNMDLLRRDEKTMRDAKRLLDNAKQNGSMAEINRLKNAYAKAKEQYENRKADIYNTDYKNKGNRFKVGVAGGWSIPEAELIMSNTERQINRSDLESVANMVYDLNQARLEIDRASGRYTESEYQEYKANRHYVPLTGDPNADVDTDIISGAGSSAVNIGRDKALKGRTSSEAEDAVDAVWKSVGKTTTYAGFAEFKGKIDDLYETEVSMLKEKGYSDSQAREQATANLGISKRKMQGLTRSSDNVLIRKEGGQYYEYELPAQAMEALRNDNVEHANAFLKVISKPIGWYARGVTQWTLTFAPMNMARDTWEKSEFIRVQKLYDKHNRLVDSKTMDKIGRATIANALSSKEVWQATKRLGFGQELRDSVPAERMLKQLLKEGGVSNYGTYLDKSETDLIKRLKKENNPIAGKLEKVGKVFESYNKMFDTVSALASYKALVENGIDSKQAAATTLELTNFRKTGSKMRGIKALYMFSQPTVMGAANLIRYLSTRKGQWRLAGYLAVMTALYTVLRAMDDDDEGGNKMDQLGDITRYIPIPIGDGHYLKLPVGFGMPQMAWNAATNLVKGMAGDISFSEMGANMFAHAFKTFAPVSPSEISAAKFPMEKIALTVTPTMLQPLMQNVINRSAFGSRITTNFVRDDKLKAEQSKATTAQFWKDVALDLHDSMGIDMHPEQIKNLVDGYSSAFGSLKELSTIFVENPNREKLGRHTRIPFVSQFIGTTNEFSIQSRYYEASEEARQLAAEYESRKNRHALDGWLDDKGDKKRLIQWHEMNESQIKTLRREKSALTKALREGRISAVAYERRLERYNKEESRLQGKLLYHWRNLQKLNTSMN